MADGHSNAVKPGRDQNEVQASSSRHCEYYCDIVDDDKTPLVSARHQLTMRKKAAFQTEKSRMFMLSPTFVHRIQVASLVIINKEEL